MTTSSIETTSASAQPTTPVTPASLFTREGIHYFLDLVMDLFPIAEKQDENDIATVNEDTRGNGISNTDTTSNQEIKSSTTKENREDNTISDNQEQETTETQRKGTGESRDSSYVTENDDDSSVEDTTQDYHFIVGGMNMSRFGGVGGNGYRSTNAINFIPTAVTERTEEDNCSLATGYRLGRSSFSSVFQQSSQQNNIVTSLSSLSQVFMSGINTTVTKSANNSVAGFTSTGGGNLAAGALSATLTNVGGTITTTGTIEKNCSNLSEDGTVTTTEESSDDSEKIVNKDTAEVTVAQQVKKEQKLEEQ